MILNNQPVLVNAAPIGTHEHAGKWTIHEYHHSAMATLGDITQVQVTGVAHYFKCTITGAVRQFGFDAPSAQGERDPRRHA